MRAAPNQRTFVRLFVIRALEHRHPFHLAIIMSHTRYG